MSVRETSMYEMYSSQYRSSSLAIISVAGLRRSAWLVYTDSIESARKRGRREKGGITPDKRLARCPSRFEKYCQRHTPTRECARVFFKISDRTLTVDYRVERGKIRQNVI